MFIQSPRNRTLLIGLSLPWLCLCLLGCSTRVKRLDPRPVHPQIHVLGGLGCRESDDVETLFAEAIRLDAACCSACVNLYFQVALATCDDDGPEDPGCRRRQLHKAALVGLVEAGQRHGMLDAATGLRLPNASVPSLSPHNHGSGSGSVVPMDHFGFVWEANDFGCLKPIGPYRTKALNHIYRCPGVGIPLVAIGCEQPDEPFLQRNPVFAATLRMRVVKCSAANHEPSPDTSENCLPEVRLELYDPLRTTRTASDAQPVKIAADLSGSLAYQLANDPQIILEGFLNPVSSQEQTRLITLEPYQPGKIPIVFIHGLLSDPFTWANQINELRAIPELSDRFQFWVFLYPTGKSVLASSALLRRELQAARTRFDPERQDPQFAKMVLIGHSMGGLVAKLQITHSGDHLWNSAASRPLEEILAPPEVIEELRSSCYFEPSPEVSRVIFLGTPHKGSLYARRLVGRIGALLVSEPARRVENHRKLIECNPCVFTEEIQRRIPTSIDLLDPKSPLLAAIGSLPIKHGVATHSVIGSIKRSPLHEPSDGVVKIESAIEGSEQSIRYIDSKHTKLPRARDSVEEIQIILRQHLEELPSQTQASCVESVTYE